MANPNKYRLNAPIPGMSLTVEKGNRPWEQPPKLTQISEVVGHYSEMLSEPDIIGSAMEAAKEGLPLETMARTMVMNGAMRGLHTVDSGFIVVPVVVEMLKSVAEINDIGYVITKQDTKGTEVSEKLAKEAIAEVMNSAKQEQMPEQSVEMPKKGLMVKE